MRKKRKRGEFEGISNHRRKKTDEEIDPLMLAKHDRLTAKDEPVEEPEEKDEQDTED